MRAGLHRRCPQLWGFVALAVGLLLGSGPAAAQYGTIRVHLWELELGTPVSDLPAEYMDPHCGTNGGPPSLRLEGWSDYADCPAGRETGLHEVWFTEDDEPEYVARAYRSQHFEPGPAAANVLFNHKVIYSLLIDDEGLIQGYRVFTDARENADYRYDAEFVGEALRQLYGYSDFECTNEPPAEGESRVDGRFVKEDCVGVVDNMHVTIERRLLRKPGQSVFDPVTRQATVGYFESSAHMEVIAADLLAGSST